MYLLASSRLLPGRMPIDVYKRQPSVVSSLLAAGSKKMGFVAAFKVFMIALVALQAEWTTAFAILAVITMTLGNVVALSQTSVKRMLAYSSVAQAGYITMAFVVMSKTALAGAILYALSHGFMKAGAFIATAAVTYICLLYTSISSCSTCSGNLLLCHSSSW